MESLNIFSCFAGALFLHQGFLLSLSLPRYYLVLTWLYFIVIPNPTLRPSTNIEHLFGTWSKGGGRKQNILFLIGVVIVWWAIWLARNECVINNCQSKIFLQILSKGHIGFGFGLCYNTPRNSRTT